MLFETILEPWITDSTELSFMMIVAFVTWEPPVIDKPALSFRIRGACLLENEMVEPASDIVELPLSWIALPGDVPIQT